MPKRHPLPTLGRSTLPWLLLGLAACGSRGDPEASLPEGQGRLTVALTASNVSALTVEQKKASKVVVHITRVTAHGTGGWTTLSETPVEVDLFRLQDSTAELGVANLPAGDVSQLRLYVDAAANNHVVTEDGREVPLRVPSGAQSGIKVKGPFALKSCEAANVTVDFDAAASIKVHATGKKDLYILRPVIRLGKQRADKVECTPGDGAPIDGTPVDAGTPDPDGGGADGGSGDDDGFPDDGGSPPDRGIEGDPCIYDSECASGFTCPDRICIAPAG
ncbi:MAG TPA: DUF4382 domain-containing protein [Myxococcaceae bacterium]|nr:DUF4382 domain-containing protein [Myxococcaceae bacterium]